MQWMRGPLALVIWSGERPLSSGADYELRASNCATVRAPLSANTAAFRVTHARPQRGACRHSGH